MSIRNYKKELENGTIVQETTYEGLGQMVEQLTKQVGRSLKVGEELEKQPDVKLYKRFTKTLEDNEKKMADYTKKLSDLRQSDPTNPLESKVSNSLNTCRKQMERLRDYHQKLEEPHRILEEEERKRKEEEAEEMRKTALQLEAEALEKEADAVNQAAGEIVEGMTILNDLTKELNTHLDEQHETIGRIEKTIDDAHEEMVAGNEDLAEAVEHQKGSTKCLLIIIGIVVGAVVIIGLIVGLTVGLL